MEQSADAVFDIDLPEPNERRLQKCDRQENQDQGDQSDRPFCKPRKRDPHPLLLLSINRHVSFLADLPRACSRARGIYQTPITVQSRAIQARVKMPDP